MINPKELLIKAEKIFFKITSGQLRGENVFPLVIPSNKELKGENYSDWKNDLVPLHQYSKASRLNSYTVEWKEKKINGTKQSIPSKIYFETLDDYLCFIQKEKDYQKIVDSKRSISVNLPKLEQWAINNPAILLENHEIWGDLIKVCEFFMLNPPPLQYYIRELPIEVHSKFIEQNSTLLKKLLDIVLPDERINKQENDFASRYGLRKVSIYTQIRILDEGLKSTLGYDECSLALDDAAWLKWQPQNVFIIENQICYLTFPKIKNSVAIFGEGFKSRISKHLSWLEHARIFCWFDLDSAGFEMLNMIRQHYPNAQQFLMDEQAFLEFNRFAVDNAGRKKELQNLSEGEQNLYQYLLTNNKRLEQERITQHYLLEQLNKIQL